MLCSLYGAEAGNLALKCLPYSGVYLAGGIATKILLMLQREEFMRSFLAKGLCRAALDKISVKVCINPDIALSGALHYAKVAKFELWSKYKRYGFDISEQQNYLSSNS